MLVSEASSTYIRARRAEGYSPATLRQYNYQLHRFAVWANPRQVEELRLNDLRDFVADQGHTAVCTSEWNKTPRRVQALVSTVVRA